MRYVQTNISEDFKKKLTTILLVYYSEKNVKISNYGNRWDWLIPPWLPKKLWTCLLKCKYNFLIKFIRKFLHQIYRHISIFPLLLRTNLLLIKWLVKVVYLVIPECHPKTSNHLTNKVSKIYNWWLFSAL